MNGGLCNIPATGKLLRNRFYRVVCPYGCSKIKKINFKTSTDGSEIVYRVAAESLKAINVCFLSDAGL